MDMNAFFCLHESEKKTWLPLKIKVWAWKSFRKFVRQKQYWVASKIYYWSDVTSPEVIYKRKSVEYANEV
jgi:hypothetical protein